MPAKNCLNRLAGEKSPYLAQHSRQPVDWRPWGQEAFDEACRLDRPVLLSIGYSACHWCHVMAEESFSDRTIAGKINENFIPIKLDREEHPDLDTFYIKAVTAITGSAGWPLTVFLTPRKQPFYGGTYFPPKDTDGTPGMHTVLDSVITAWKNNRPDILGSAGKIAALITANVKSAGPRAPVNETLLRRGYDFLQNNYDPTHGGFGAEPKFPIAFYIRFLLRYYKRTHSLQSLDMAETTLHRMITGGIYDQLDGGIHRYSTDDRWHLPHFEKMLYDQALVSRALLECFQVTGNAEFARAGRQTIDFVLAQMLRARGGFFSSLSADSIEPHTRHSKEGAFYLWNKPEIDSVLGSISEIFCYRYGVARDGNIDPRLNGFDGWNVLYQAHSIDETSRHFRLTRKEADKIISRAKKRLLARRGGRPWPNLDDKILCDWNSMMISSLCLAHRIFPNRGYGQAAERTAVLILEHMRDSRGRVYHRLKDWEVRIHGLLDDYAFLCDALIDLFEATQAIKYLQEAVKTAALMLNLFWDNRNKGFFINAPESTPATFVQKEMYDAAIPSGNSAALSALIRLHALTGGDIWKQRVRQLVDSVSGEITGAPYSYINLLVPVASYLAPMRRVVISARNAHGALKFIRAAGSRFLPDTVTVLRPWEDRRLDQAEKIIPYLRRNRPRKGGEPLAYVCCDGTCKHPASSPEEMLEQLEGRCSPGK